MSRTRQILKNALHWQFVVGQRAGFDILPRHFYSEVPDIAKLRAQNSWRKPYQMERLAGADYDGQLAFLRHLTSREPVRSFEAHEAGCRENGEPGFGPVEAEVLDRFVMLLRPRNVMQVGAGVSTAVILRAAARAGYRPEITCIDPFPTRFLQSKAQKGEITLVASAVQDLDPSLTGRLSEGDLFFVDSTHTLGPAGEVTRLITEWLPTLRPGVRVHFHDIMFPYDYMPDLLSGSLFFPHETALLYAFLCMNPHFRILCSLAMLHHNRRHGMAELLPAYSPAETVDGLTIKPGHFPSSVYLERIPAPA